MKIYTLRVLISFDQFVNALLGGYPNETLSARAWRCGHVHDQKYWRWSQATIDMLFSGLHPDHCEDSYHYCKKPHKTCGIYYATYCGKCSANDAEIRVPLDHSDFL